MRANEAEVYCTAGLLDMVLKIIAFKNYCEEDIARTDLFIAKTEIRSRWRITTLDQNGIITKIPLNNLDPNRITHLPYRTLQDRKKNGQSFAWRGIRSKQMCFRKF